MTLPKANDPLLLPGNQLPGNIYLTTPSMNNQTIYKLNGLSRVKRSKSKRNKELYSPWNEEITSQHNVGTKTNANLCKPMIPRPNQYYH